MAEKISDAVNHFAWCAQAFLLQKNENER